MFVEFKMLNGKSEVAVDINNVKEVCVEVLLRGEEEVPCTKIRFYQGGDDESLFVAEDFLTVVRRLNDARLVVNAQRGR